MVFHSSRSISTLSTALPAQRWQIANPNSDLVQAIATQANVSPLLAQVMINRDLTELEQVQVFLNPETQVLPSPLTEFVDLPVSLELLINAINQRQRIAICGDYDADGMTSTALLLRALRSLGGIVDYAIPSRMSEGYGINRRIIEEFYEEGVRLILTVDNGIAAHAPIARARELGMAVIITDHHDLPPKLPDANAILNPKQLPNHSPYKGLAGVGVAYVLARALADSLGNPADLGNSLLELFTLGTIADLAPLTGVNRRWVQAGLRHLPKSRMAGVQALVEATGLGGEKNLKPEAIGFRLGPRINAVGRIADPVIVIELLTTDDPAVAQERATACEQINLQRQGLCAAIEQEAIALCEAGALDVTGDRVLVLVQHGWHHGVIGIVASRLVERYGVPVFIGTYEDEAGTVIRGSARSIPEFHIFEALEYCKDLLEKHGGHQAAGGFSLKADNLEHLRSRLRDFAHQYLEPEHLKPLVKIDAQAAIANLDFGVLHELDVLQPCGIQNNQPVFWSANVRIHDQKIVGKDHLKFTVSDDSAANGSPRKLAAIAWRWGTYYPLPTRVDIAYTLETNDWNGEQTLQLNIAGVRPSSVPEQRANFVYNDRTYVCRLVELPQGKELRIRNDQGKVLSVQQGQRIGTLTKNTTDQQTVNVCQAPYFELIKAAKTALQLE